MSKEQSVFLTNSDLQLQGGHGLSEFHFHLALDVEKMGDSDKNMQINKERGLRHWEQQTKDAVGI